MHYVVLWCWDQKLSYPVTKTSQLGGLEVGPSVGLNEDEHDVQVVRIVTEHILKLIFVCNENAIHDNSDSVDA